MTGNLSLLARNADPVRFEHLAIGVGENKSLRFSDQRKFGRVIHLLPQEADTVEGKVGPEPLSPEFTSEVFAQLLARRMGPIKSILLNQKVVAGIGNIYADEALFRARVHPLTPANKLSADQFKSLHRAIRHVLHEGLQNRGTSISHFRDGAGQEGANQNNLKVYGKGSNGGRCPRCGGQLEAVVIAGRTSHFCPSCQRLPD
jgi:formamidopyrimidine-DNA glycosylase